MAFTTLNATSNTTPDPGQGGSAVTGNSNTGHSASTSAASAGASQSKTCVWQSYGASGGQVLSIALKWSWSVTNGTADVTTNGVGDSADCTIAFTAQYSTNGGGAWTTQTNQAVAASASAGNADSKTLSNSGSESVTLAVTQDLTQVRVRDKISCVTSRSGPGPNTCNGSITASISNIRIEVTTVDARAIAML